MVQLPEVEELLCVDACNLDAVGIAVGTAVQPGSGFDDVLKTVSNLALVGLPNHFRTGARYTWPNSSWAVLVWRDGPS